MSSQSVSLSKASISILKVAAAINPSFLAKPGSTIRALSASGAIFMTAQLDEVFPQEFAIYELPRLLQVLTSSAMSGSSLNFSPAEDFMVIMSGKTKVNYHFTDPTFVKYKDQDITVSDENIVVDLTEGQIGEIRKMASVLGHTHINFVVAGEKLSIVCTTPELDKANKFEMELGENINKYVDGSYTLKLDNLLLLDGNYKVTVFKGAVTEWAHDSGKLKVYIGLEKK